MHKDQRTPKLYVVEQTVAELAQAFDRAPSEVNARYADQCDPNGSHKGAGEHWYGEGIKSIADARRMLDAGWEKGARKALAIRDSLGVDVPKAKSRRRRQEWAADGDTLDVDRGLAGQWDTAYRTTRRELVDGRSVCVTLVAGWGGNCTRSPEQLFWSGAAMLALSDILEEAGQSVRLLAVQKIDSNDGERNVMVNAITVKDHGEPLRVDALAGVVCHAGIYRTFGFHSTVEAPFHVGFGLGRTASWGEIDGKLKDAGYLQEDNTIRLDDCYDRESAIAEVRRVIGLLQGPQS